MSSVHKDFSHPPPLQVYSLFDDALLVPTLPLPPTMTVEPDLPTVIRKGIRSTRNPSSYFTALSYHRLSQPFLYLSFCLFLLCQFQKL